MPATTKDAARQTRGRPVPPVEQPTAVEPAGLGGLAVRKVRPAYHQVAEQLRALILTGELAPGARLPTEPELSTMFGVSRSTVREALRVLSSQHLVITTRGASGGTSVASPEPEDIGNFLEASFGLMSGVDAVTVDQFVELRELIEVPATRLAALHRTEDQLRSLEQCIEHTAANHDGEGPAQSRASFHSVILEAAGNPLLAVVARPVVGVLRGHFLRDTGSPAFWRQMTQDHVEIHALIEAGDGEGAAEAMRSHLVAMRPIYAKVERPRRAAGPPASAMAATATPTKPAKRAKAATPRRR
jgi:GntR family transcriptional repressor for pyruvate dehydrogenase complex